MVRAGIIFLVICIMTHNVSGQSPYFQKYFLLKKNEQIHVNKIFQDRDGFMWYGTNSGLFKFDGVTSQHYTTSNGLPDNNVTALAQDSIGRIWTGYRSGRIAILDDKGIEKFNPEEGTSTNEISDILFDKRGNLWFSTFNDGVYSYVKNRLYRFDEDNGLPDIFIYDIAEDSIGNIWLSTDGGAVSCKMMNGKLDVTILNSKSGLPDNIIKKILPGIDHTIFMATEDAGIIRYNTITHKFKPLMDDPWRWGSIADFLISDSQVWIGLQQGGIVIFDLKTKQTKYYSDKIEPSLASITTLMEDYEGNIWVGSKNSISRSFNNHIETIDYFDGTNANILSLTFDKSGDLWFSNNEGLFKRQVIKDTPVVTKQLNGTAFQKAAIISLYCDRDGFIWAGLYGEGVLRINPKTNSITYINKELRNGNVLHITGKGSIVWLATLGGSARIDIAGEKLDIKTYSKQDGLISDYIYQVFVDSRDRVWFATDGKGADMLDDEGFHHYESAFASKVIYGFAEDVNHNVWANTQDDGLYRYDSGNFHKEPGLNFRDDNIVALNADSFGNIIVMHDLGIDVVDVQQMRIHHLGDERNIRNKIANLNATTKDRYGRIYFGTDNGIVSCSSLMYQKMSSAKPSITGIKVLNKKINPVQGLALAYDQNSVTINYLGIWHQNPEDLRFQYQLTNYDHDWIESSDRAVTYSSLQPGDYVFRLRISDTENFEGAREATYAFTIKPPFWKTKFFYVMISFLFALMGYGILKFRERKLVRDTLILKHKVEIRTNEIQKKNEEINAQAEEIKGINENLEMLVRERTAELEKKNKALEEYAFIIAHELRAPVASILGLINLMSKAELEHENKIIVDHMTDSAGKLNSIVRSITTAIEQGETTHKES